MSNRRKRRSLSARSRPTQRYGVPFGTAQETARALAALNAAQERLRGQEQFGTAAEVEEAQKAADAAQAAYDALFEWYTFQGIPPEQYRALEAAHPPTEAQTKANANQTTDEDTFVPALAFACCTDDDKPTLEEWSADYAAMTGGERSEIQLKLYQANGQSFVDGLPKS